MFSLDCNLTLLLEITIYPLSMTRGNEVTLNDDAVAFLRDSGFVQQTHPEGLSEGSRFFGKNVKIAPLLKAPDEGVRR